MKITTESDRAQFIKRVNKVKLDKPWRMSAEVWKESGKERSLMQNRLAFLWYSQLGKQSGNGKDYERNFCKFTYGCSILIENDGVGDFTAFYEQLISSYEYEQCVSAMEFISITSLMNTKQFAEYLNHIELYAGERGCQLTHPDDLYDQALGLTREKPMGVKT